MATGTKPERRGRGKGEGTGREDDGQIMSHVIWSFDPIFEHIDFSQAVSRMLISSRKRDAGVSIEKGDLWALVCAIDLSRARVSNPGRSACLAYCQVRAAIQHGSVQLIVAG